MNEGRLPEPIVTMIREHATLLALLDDLSNGVAVQDVPDTGKLAELVNSFLHCLNTHIHKEEDILFPYVRAALGSDVEALSIFEAEHAVVGNLRGQFSDLAKRFFVNETCDPKNISRLAELVGQAREVMPPHIFKEDNVLYPLAGQIISQEALRQLAAEAKNASRTE